MANPTTTAGGPMDNGDPFRRLTRMRQRMQHLMIDARRIWKALNKLEERADALVHEFLSLLADTAEPAAKGRTSARRPGAATREEARRLEILARQGVGELGIEHRADGHELARVDRGRNSSCRLRWRRCSLRWRWTTTAAPNGWWAGNRKASWRSCGRR